MKTYIMADTYTQIHIHAVFCVKNRQSLILPSWKNHLHKYITSVVQENGHKMLAINGIEDHIHILFGMRPIQSLSELMQRIKGNSSRWINENGFVTGRFSWQEGYGAFSFTKSKVPIVIEYIMRQEEHHKRRDFFNEDIDILRRFEVEYDERYLFKPV